MRHNNIFEANPITHMVQSKPCDLCQHEKRKLKDVEKEKNELGEILKNYNLSSKDIIEQKQ